jgi:hypothetical protein
MYNVKNYAQEIKAILELNKPTKRGFGNGLYFKVHKSASTSWVYRYQYNNKRKEVVLGKAFSKHYKDLYTYEYRPVLSFNDAMITALNYDNDLKLKQKDPQITLLENKKGFETLDDIAQDYFSVASDKVNDIKPTMRKYELHIKKVLGHYSVQDISPLMISDLLIKINRDGKPSTSNDVLYLLKSHIFPRAVKLGKLKINPAREFTPRDAGGTEHERKRALSLSEVSIVLNVMYQNPKRFSYPNYLASILLLIVNLHLKLIHDLHLKLIHPSSLI